jgi:hypothetical protein
MRRTLCTLLALGAMTGCGDSDEANGTRDTTAPTLTLSTPTITPASGDTIVISVAAADNIDPTVAYALSCTGGGRLTGNSLVLPDVTADTAIQCTATATDAAGNTGTGTLALTIKPSNARAALFTGSEAVSAGGSGMVLVDNLALTQESYDATIGGRAVKIARVDGNALMFTAPLDLEPGTHPLRFTIGSRNYAFDLTIGTAVNVADPRAAIMGMMRDARDRLTARLDDNGLTAADRGTVTDAIGKIDRSVEALASISDADVAKLAGLLAANGAISNGRMARLAYNPIVGGQDCLPALRAFARPAVLAIGGAAWLYSATSVAIAVGAAAPALVVPDIIFAGLGIAAGSALTVIKGREAYNAYPNMKAKCWTETSIDLLNFLDTQSNARLAMMVSAMTVADKQAFSNKTSRSFRVSRSFAPQAAIRAEVTRLFDEIVTRVASSAFITDDLRSQLREFEVDGSEVVPAANISLGSISRGDIAGELQVISPEAVRLTFSYTGQGQPSDNVDFTFALNRTGEPSTPVSAQLSVRLPEADDAAIETVQDTPATAMVQARGATSLEVVRQPANGTVSISADGSFRYNPGRAFFGTDTFVYRARNEQGVSREATVSISVVRRFEGAWHVTIRSTTTSQSQPGLCPAEQNSFQVLVSKVSDTQYSANYQGYDLELTMSGKDDPAGPKGTRTVTYPDDPGRTTETVTVQIPDSRRLFGTSFFEYTGPGGTFCRGNVEITGTR